jgi:hypothetical protein
MIGQTQTVQLNLGSTALVSENKRLRGLILVNNRLLLGTWMLRCSHCGCRALPFLCNNPKLVKSFGKTGIVAGIDPNPSYARHAIFQGLARFDSDCGQFP